MRNGQFHGPVHCLSRAYTDLRDENKQENSRHLENTNYYYTLVITIFPELSR